MHLQIKTININSTKMVILLNNFKNFQTNVKLKVNVTVK